MRFLYLDSQIKLQTNPSFFSFLLPVILFQNLKDIANCTSVFRKKPQLN